MQSESVNNIIPALIKTATEIFSVDKNSNVGSGSGSYKGVRDMDIKVATRVMFGNGLIVTPLHYSPKLTIERWEEEDTYKKVMKTKQSAFVELESAYRVYHTSGEFIDIVGYGHGTDTQDKAAGKATTYALKYALIYMFNMVIGDIDDADLVHSNDIQVPPAKVEAKPEPPTEKVEGKKVEPKKAVAKKPEPKVEEKPAEPTVEEPPFEADEPKQDKFTEFLVKVDAQTDKKALLDLAKGFMSTLSVAEKGDYIKNYQSFVTKKMSSI